MSVGRLLVSWAFEGTYAFPLRFERGPGTNTEELIGVATVQPAQELLRANPELALYQMHDPNQDRLMSQIMPYFRVKRLQLGTTYERSRVRFRSLPAAKNGLGIDFHLSPSGFIVSQTDIPFFHSERTEESHQHESS